MGEAKRKKQLLGPAQFLSLGAAKLDEAEAQDFLYPQKVLESFSGQWNGVWKWCEYVRMNMPAQHGEWASWCFLPINYMSSILHELTKDKISPAMLEQFMVSDIRLGASLAAWRLTKGVYRFDPTVAESLMKTALQDNINTEVLFRLPEWCIYVPTPGLTFMDCPLHGFFASIDDHYTKAQKFDPELNIVLMLDATHDSSGGFDIQKNIKSELLGFPKKQDPKYTPMQLALTLRKGVGISELVKEMMGDDLGKINPLIKNHLDEMVGKLQETNAMLIEKAKAEGNNDLLAEAMDAPTTIEGLLSAAASGNTNTLKKILSLLLYICSQNADLTPRGQHKQGLAELKKTKKGVRLFESDRVNAWDVGLRIGAEIRRYANDEKPDGGETGIKMRPHIRRAHWHSYWKGPLSDPEARTIDIRWLPPVPVNVESADDIVPVVRNIT